MTHPIAPPAMDDIRDRFHRAALAECREAYRRTNDPGWLSLESLASMEHQIRFREYDQRIQPLIQLRARMWPIDGFSFVQNADGGLGEKTEHWSEQQLKAIAQIDAMIAWHAGECGVGPKCDPPTLGELISISKG